MHSDIQIAQAATLKPIGEVGARLGLVDEELEPFGRSKAKISLGALQRRRDKPDGKLILVTAISPTPAGEGKTTMTVGLGDALNRIGRRTVICLREPSLGPVFGVKGGAAGGGRAQVVPMEDINLHFTGDFAAIALAHNLLSAVLDNHLHHGNDLRIDPRRITWKRVVDLNDRALRRMVVGLGGSAHGVPREDGFDIVVASEVMAIVCLSSSLQELKARLGEIIVGYTQDGRPVRARDLKCHGAMAALLKDAIKPNLVQTLENNPAILHGGPFANIAHGCNSVIATKLAMKLGEYVVTEAGFGADLGAEKFIDIKCRSSGLWPAAAVLVATVRALKFHGGVAKEDLNREDPEAVRRGLPNLLRHLDNITDCYNLPCVVGLNHFSADSAAEIAVVLEAVCARGIRVEIAKHWAEGGAGAEGVARAIDEIVKTTPARSATYLYDDQESLRNKIEAVARRVYRAGSISVDEPAAKELRRIEEAGFASLPVCIAKTQYSFSSDANLRGAPEGHSLRVREVRLAAGARFVVVICGDIMTMPGLPKVPSAERIDIDDDGRIIGLS